MDKRRLSDFCSSILKFLTGGSYLRAFTLPHSTYIFLYRRGINCLHLSTVPGSTAVSPLKFSTCPKLWNIHSPVISWSTICQYFISQKNCQLCSKTAIPAYGGNSCLPDFSLINILTWAFQVFNNLHFRSLIMSCVLSLKNLLAVWISQVPFQNNEFYVVKSRFHLRVSLLRSYARRLP